MPQSLEVQQGLLSSIIQDILSNPEVKSAVWTQTNAVNRIFDPENCSVYSPGTNEKKSPVIIAHANQKGGVGKTTINFNQALWLSSQGYKVCVVDFDPQCNISTQLMSDELHTQMVDQEGDFFYSHHLFDTTIEPAQITCIKSDLADNLFVIPAHSHHLSNFNSSISGDVDALLQPLKSLKSLDFDFIMLDTPPSITFSQAAALIAADVLFVPCQIDEYSRSGLFKLLQVVSQFVEVKTSLNVGDVPVIKVYFSIYEATATRSVMDCAIQKIEQLMREEFGDFILSSVFRKSKAMSEASVLRKAIFQHQINGGARVASKQAQSVFTEMFQSLTPLLRG